MSATPGNLTSHGPYITTIIETKPIATCHGPDAKANAERLAQARNCHEQLVEALETAVRQWDIRQHIHWRRVGLPRPDDDAPKWVITARAALQAAQPKEGK